MLYAVLGEETAWKGPGMIIMEPTAVADGWWRGRSGPETEPCTYPFCRSPCNTPTYKRSATKIILCTLYCVRIYDMLGTMHPGNTVPKGGGCLHIQCMYLQPKNSIGRVEISDRNGHRNGVMIHKMDGTSRAGDRSRATYPQQLYRFKSSGTMYSVLLSMLWMEQCT